MLHPFSILPLLAQVEAATPTWSLLLSPWKPLLVGGAVYGWAWAVEKIDKDAEYYMLPREWIGGAHLGAGALGVLLMFAIPWFFLGLPLGLAVLAGSLFYYAQWRNAKVPKAARWTLDASSFTKRVEEAQQRQAEKRATVKLLKRDETAIPLPQTGTPEAEAHALLEELVHASIPRDAERIDLVITAEQARPSVRIDGVDYPQSPMDPKTAMRLVDTLKAAAGLDVEDRRRRQTGSLKVQTEGHGRRELQIITAGSTRGVQFQALIDPEKRSEIPLEKLGLLKPQVEALRGVLEEDAGVVIIAGPKRQGVTTTVYAMLREHDPYTQSVATIESKMEFLVEGLNHIELGDAVSGPQVREAVSKLLRSDPQVMMLWLIPDAQTAGMVADAADHVRVYLPMRADDAFSALSTYVKAVGDRGKAASGLRAVMAQRLVRKLCPTCRQAYTPDPAALRKFNLPADRINRLYQAGGKVKPEGEPEPIICPNCHGLGYKGRVGVFEVMVFDEEARKLLAAGDAERLRAHLRKGRMLYLSEAGLTKVVEGVTDIKEATRGLNQKNPTPKAE